MGSQATVPWTDSAFAPDERRSQSELTPYRVRLGDDLYDQSDFTADTTHRYHNFTSGIGAGKTVAGVIRCVANAERWNPGEMGMIVTPTSLGIKNVILPELAKWGILDHWDYHGPQSEQPGLHLPNGTRILLESADNTRKIERLRGPSLAWFWMDEAALIPEKAWRILTGRLRAGNYRNGFITTTPKGFNWIYETFIDADTRIDDVNNVIGVPSYANPHLPYDYRTDILDDYSGQFAQQEVLGKFVQFEGLVYPWFRDESHIVDAVEANIRQPFYGVDWGFNNPSVILACGETTRNELGVLEEFYEPRVTDDDLAQVATDMQQRHGRGPVFCDPAEPDSIETFRRHGLAAVAADNSVAPGIKHVAAQHDRLLVMRDCQQLINEFGMYRYPDDKSDEQPVAVNDHAMDALRYALFTYHQHGGQHTDMAGLDFI